ncbi:MAG: OmpA family protein, partial [Butyricimonas sp.]|nr:OmpA family protein [Butyricimonas sp.]
FMKENPDVRVRLTGFADKRGTDKANMIISERRVNAVADMFISKYGINKDRIVKDHKGVSSRYDKDEWNRCVLVEIIK